MRFNILNCVRPVVFTGANTMAIIRSPITHFFDKLTETRLFTIDEDDFNIKISSVLRSSKLISGLNTYRFEFSPINTEVYNKEVKQLTETSSYEFSSEMCKELFFFAVNNADSRVITPLVRHKVVDINAINIDGETALHLATRSKNSELVSLLLKLGAYTDITNAEGETALHIAAKSGITDIGLNFLLNAGAQINARTAAGDTALKIAIKHSVKNTDKIKFLIEKGALLDNDGDYEISSHFCNKDQKLVLNYLYSAKTADKICLGKSKGNDNNILKIKCSEGLNFDIAFSRIRKILETNDAIIHIDHEISITVIKLTGESDSTDTFAN